MLKLITLLLLCTCLLEASQDGHLAIDWKCNEQIGQTPVRYVQIFGERCSGTTFLQRLIENNFPDTQIDWNFGWKHFPCWYDTPWAITYADRFPQPFRTLENNDEYLFIVIFRDPLDWLSSYYRQPFHDIVDRSSFSTFIRSPWQPDESAAILDLNPENGKLFENVMKLRSRRITNMLMIKEKVKNIYYLNYEILRDFPKETLEEISSLYHIKKNESFTPILGHRGNTKAYVQKKYPPIESEDLRFILNELDLYIEKQIGYSPDHADNK